MATFGNEAELQGSEWLSYIDAVYGVDTLTYPFTTGRFDFFYRHLLPASVLGNLPPFVAHPSSPNVIYDPLSYRYGNLVRYWSSDGGDYGNFVRNFRHGNRGCTGPPGKEGSSFTWPLNASTVEYQACLALESVLSRGIPDNSYAEVTHQCCDGDSFSMTGWWMYHRPGSGIYFNVGKTFVTIDHSSFPYHVRQATGCGGGWQWPPARQCLLNAGYDTVQFVKYVEHALVHHEIVHLHDSDTWHQSHGCPGAQYANRFRSGWMASRPCNCYPGYPNGRTGWGSMLNCAG